MKVRIYLGLGFFLLIGLWVGSILLACNGWQSHWPILINLVFTVIAGSPFIACFCLMAYFIGDNILEMWQDFAEENEEPMDKGGFKTEGERHP